MFNIGSGELILIAVVALLVLGPSRLPEFARGISKFIREFRKQTDDVRHVVEREFYRMDQDLSEPGPVIATPEGLAPHGQPDALHDEHGRLLPPADGTQSQVTAGMPQPAAEQTPAPIEPAPASTLTTANAPPAEAAPHPPTEPEKPT